MKYESYLPVSCDFYDELTLLSVKKKPTKIFYFQVDNEIGEESGLITDIVTRNKEEYVVCGDGEVRLDKIITYNGRPGPAFDEYDSYANACLNCNLGY